MIDSLRGNIDKRPNEVMTDMYRDCRVRLNYTQAYRGKEKALREIHGRVEDSYIVIPWICDRLVETDPDTVARCEFSENNKFERVFIAYGCSIKGFLRGCQAILYIDGCHLSDLYKGTLVLANAYDGDDQLFPLAYAIVSRETHDEWRWFLQNLKNILGTLQVTLVSDKNPGIISAVQSIFGGDKHAFCYRHVKENFSSEYQKISRGRVRTSSQNKEDALKMLDAIACLRHKHEYNVAIGKLKSFCPELAQWVEVEGDVSRWAQGKFPHKRWDKLTTNIAESFNAWILRERKHNVDVCIHEHRERLAKKIVACKEAMLSWSNGIGPNVEAKLIEEVNAAENMVCTYYGDDQVSVAIFHNNQVVNLTVDLTEHMCTCLKWQMSGIPCSYVCAAIKLLHRCVYSYVEDCYKLVTQQKIYAALMRPVPTHDQPRGDALTVTDMLTQTLLEDSRKTKEEED